MIDRVAAAIGKPMVEVPVGFKWFVPGLIDGSFGFGGEESAGASFLRMRRLGVDDRQGRPASCACSPRRSWRAPARRPSEHYAELVAKHGDPAYARVDAPANREQKAKLAALSPDDVTATELAGEQIIDKLTAAPGNGAEDRRPQGDDRECVVRGAPVRHRGRLQDLRRVVPRPRPPRRGPGRGPRGACRRPWAADQAGPQAPASVVPAPRDLPQAWRRTNLANTVEQRASRPQRRQLVGHHQGTRRAKAGGHVVSLSP